MSTDEDLDCRLGAALGAELHEELADLTAPPGLAVAVRRRRGRQRWVLTGAVTLPVVAAGVAVALIAPQGVRGGPPANAGGAQPHTVAFLAAHTEQALDGTGGSIIHTVTNVDDGALVDTWSDVTGARMVSSTGPAGAPTGTIQESVVGDQLVFLNVDYARRVWYRDSVSRPDKLITDVILGVLYGDPASIRADLARGSLVVIGTEQVAGHATEHLRLSIGDDGSVAAAEDLWVDSTTFLPVRLTGRKGPRHFTVTYDWLPRTAGNLAHLELTPPAGFTQLPSGGGKDGAAASPAAKPTPKG